MEVLRWSGEQARAAVAAPDLDRRLGAAYGVSGLIVDLGAETGADLAPALTALPVVAIGCGVQADSGWDVATTDPDPIAAAIEMTPRAAVITAQLLRGQAGRAFRDGLATESLAYATLQAGPEFAAWLASRGRRVRNDDAPRVQVEDDAGTAVIILDRPRLRNLMDARMRDELVDAFRALAVDPTRPIRIEARGPAFCAGGDLAEFGSMTDPTLAHLIRSSANVAPWLADAASRTTAMIRGACVGAGVELASFCHRVIAESESTFRLPELRMGLLPGAGGTVSIPARIGRPRTLEWLLRDTTIDAPTAHEWGLIDEIA